MPRSDGPRERLGYNRDLGLDTCPVRIVGLAGHSPDTWILGCMSWHGSINGVRNWYLKGAV